MNLYVHILVFGWLSAAQDGSSPRRHDSPAHSGESLVKAETAPMIRSQKDGGPGRTMVEVQNPLDQPVWVYIECPTTVAAEPLIVTKRTTSTINLAYSGGKCLLHHWRLVWPEVKRPVTRERGSNPKKLHHQRGNR